MNRMPALFVSHGAPSLVLDDVPARAFLARVGSELGRPTAIVVVSAHYEAPTIRVDRSARPRTIHDFGGFAPALYEIQYPAPGDPVLADEIVALLRGAGLAAGTDTNWGLDHGAWVPLSLMYPDAGIPVVAVSVDPFAGPAHHRALGAALAPLREGGVLVIGSGSLTHNLHEIPRSFRSIDTPAPDWVRAFAEWVAAAIAEGREDDLLDYRRKAPHGARNHPTEEHFLPLFTALGAGGGGSGRRLHDSTTFAVLRMDAYAFG